MSEQVAETGNPGGEVAADAVATNGAAGSESFLASIADQPVVENGVGEGSEPAKEPDTTTAEGITQQVMDGPPEGVPQKFWDADKKAVKVDDLAKGYSNLEKLLSREKVPVPTNDDDEEGWERWHAAVRPESEEAYQFERPEMPPGMEYNEDEEQSFRNWCFANGISQRQAANLYQSEVAKRVEQHAQWHKMREEQRANLTVDLQREHGQQFQAVIQRNQAIMSKYADPEFREFLNESGAGDDPRMIRFLDRIGRDMGGETKLVGKSEPTAQPADLDAAIAAFNSKNQKVLFDKTHPDHGRIVQERQNYSRCAMEIPRYDGIGYSPSMSHTGRP
jgi:hypothetical protein